MRVLTVVGARPQFVKAAAVSRALRRRHEEVLLHTGQHHDPLLSDVFFRDLGLPDPDAHLGVSGGPSGTRLAAMIRGVEAEVRARRADAVLVYGDTDSTLAGALAARAARVPLVHVEAGLRSGDLGMCEERNRIAADHLAALLLCPTPRAAERLRGERASGRVEVVGDVMLDVCLAAVERRPPGRRPEEYLLATVHRAETTDDPVRLESVLLALESLPLPVVLPCHPRTLEALRRAGLPGRLRNVEVVDPLPYPEMLFLLRRARALLTDSGGLQKEALFHAVPCLTLRESTEWPETVESGWNRLVGTDPRSIRDAVADLARPSAPPDLGYWGSGRAAERVADALDVLRGAG